MTYTLHLRGDEGELFRLHHRRLVRLVAGDVRAPDVVVEDGCAFAWIQLCRKQPDRESVVGWLRVVARREAYRLLARQRGLVPLDDPVGAPAADETAGSLTLADLLPGDFDLDRIVEAREALHLLAGLRWRRRRALALRAAGYSYKEIARMLGVSYTNVNRHVTEGRAELRELRDAASGGRLPAPELFRAWQRRESAA